MKKCPTCDKTFEDSMRFCQIDGTSLVEDAPAFDPYATIVGRAAPPPAKESAATPEPTVPQPERESAIHATVGSIPISEPDDVLDLPSKDPLKTMYVSEAEMHEALNKPDQPDIIEIPAIEPAPAPAPPSFITNEPEPPAPVAPAPPPSPFGGVPDSNPVSSPFAEREFNAGEAPIAEPPTFNEEPLRFDEAATMMQSGSDRSFDQPEAAAQWTPSPAPEAVQWTPPSAPEQNWQNQPIGAETPFQPPVAGTDGANKTLSVVSLITGILGLTLCCGAILPSVAAIVTGIMARGRIQKNPAEYGGAGFATAGIITGVLGLVGGIIFLVVYFVVGIASLNLN